MASKRKRPRRRKQTSPPALTAFEKTLDSILNGNSTDISRLGEMVPEELRELLEGRERPLTAPVKPAKTPNTSYNQGCDEIGWRGGLDYLLETLAQKTVKAGQKIEVAFDSISPDEYFYCHCSDGKRKYRSGICVNAELLSVSSACSCGARNVCSHVCAVAEFGLREMDSPKSPVRRKILDELGLVEDPSLLPGEQTLMFLESFAKQHRPSNADEFDDKIHNDSRIAWRLVDRGRLALIPLLQKAKKRGNGFTKGREIRLESLHYGNRHTASDLDMRVLRALEPNFYGDAANVYAGLQELIGHDCVEFGGLPIDVVQEPFVVEVVEEADQLRINVMPGHDVFAEPDYDGLVAIREDQVKLVPGSRAELELARKAYFGELTVPKERKEELLRHLQAITGSVTVSLPEGSFVSSEQVEVDPVLRLKSYQDGSLRCGLRIRVNDRLHLPGRDCLLRYEKTKQGLAQYRRDAKAELESLRTIREGIGFPTEARLGEWDWRLTQFADSIALLERLGDRGDELGVEALWDEDSVDPVQVLGSITPSNVRVEVKRKKDWFGIEGGFELNGNKFSLHELLSAVESEPTKGFTQLKPGMWAKISDRLRKRLLELRDAAHVNRSKLEVDITAVPIIQSLKESELDITAGKEWEASVQRLEKAKKIRPRPSKEFKAELRDYQLEGYRWMRRLAEWGVGACLADDMGLGKTIQALAVLVDRAKEGPALVIAPTSVGFNWQRESNRFAPSLNAHLYRETDRQGFLEEVTNDDVVICSYGLALRDAEHLAKVKWGTLVLDEAQFLKNARSKTAQAIRTISADWKLALTGTPIENHLGELWSLFRTISPGLFGSWEQFRKRFAAPIEKNDDPERREALSRIIRPFVLRRTKGEVLRDLPERTEINLHVDLSEEERRRYDEMRLAAVGEIDELVGLPETNDQRFRVLAILTRLRQMACHVGLVDESWDGESAKLSLLVEKVKELRDEQHRVLIFSQFTKYLDLIRKTLAEEGVTFEYLDGQTPPKKRQERVDRFQEGNTDAFLISLKAGGTGLNLTAADYVIHMDPWWNPAVEDQATDRSHRIGQTRPVIVYRIISRGTVEDQILSLHADKRDLVSSVMEGTQKAGKLSTNELLDLIRGD